MRLFSYWRSSSSYRVRIALALKGIEAEVVPIHLRDGEQHAEAHLSRSPLGQVPVLEVDGPEGPVHLTQSVAILEYLEETYPEPPLLPRESIARAQTRALVEVVNSGIQPLQNFAVLKKLAADHGADRIAWAAYHNLRGLEAMQRLAAPTAGRYCVGDEVTLADCALVPQLYNARRFGVDVDGALPLLARLDANLTALPAFQAAHPDRQVDAPTDPPP
jgi:maleylpyruvate isomerase